MSPARIAATHVRLFALPHGPRPTRSLASQVRGAGVASDASDRSTARHASFPAGSNRWLRT